MYSYYKIANIFFRLQGGQKSLRIDVKAWVMKQVERLKVMLS